VKHLRGARLITGAVVEEVLHLRLRLCLGLERPRGVQALGARDRGHDGGEVGELLGLDGDELIAGLRGLERAGRAWLAVTNASIWVRVESRFCTTPACTRMVSWNPARAFCQRDCASARSCCDEVPLE
jgi:hypothetical protein